MAKMDLRAPTARSNEISVPFFQPGRKSPTGLMLGAIDVDKLKRPRGRRALEAQIEAMISLLDLLDGDTDLEDNGDATDGSFAEDEECRWSKRRVSGPGCLISDDDSAVDDMPCDPLEDCAI